MSGKRYPEYEAAAMFRCSQGCGSFRRDRCKTFRGSLCCPVCGWRWTLSYVAPETQARAPIGEQE